MTFISSSEVKKCIFHECRRHEWNIHIFHFTRWNKSSFEWSEKMYISWAPKARMKYTIFFTSRDKIKVPSSEVKKCTFHERRRHEWNIHIFHFTRWNKSHIHDKHLNFLFIIYITFDRRDAILAFARGSLTRSFVLLTSTPWRSCFVWWR